MAACSDAFLPGTRVSRAHKREGVLSGLSFAVKDLFDIRGHISSAGCPDYARSHGPAERDAPVVDTLLDAGADLVGVTIMDELAYSLAGQNPFYGTPLNPRAPQRLCGGSSCGSASVVAACACDFALGTDTGGSVRVPASFCGLYGLRPTYAALSAEGVVPLAPGFDTVGFLAREARTFESVARALFGAFERAAPERMLVLSDAMLRAEPAVQGALDAAFAQVAEHFGLTLERVRLTETFEFAQLSTAFRRLQAREVWAVHGAWFLRVQPTLSPAVRARFDAARALAESDEGRAEDEQVRSALREALAGMLTPRTLLCMPVSPGPAPRIDETGPALELFRSATLELTSLASLAGVPQLVCPARELQGAPVGVSFVSAAGSDAFLCALAGSIEDAVFARP